MWRIKLLLAAAALVLLGLGGVELLEYFKFPHVQVMPYARFVQKRPQEGWFRITGARPDVLSALRMPGRTSHEQQYYVPYVSSVMQANNNAPDGSESQETAFLVVSTTDPKRAEMGGEVRADAANGSNVTSVSFPSQDVEGVLVTGLHSDSKMRKKIAAVANVAEDYVILKDGRKPSFLKGLGIIGLGLILAIGQILYYRSDWHDA